MSKIKILALTLVLAITSMYLPSCAQQVEAADFTGVLTVANNDRIIVSNAQETKTFVTDNATKYDMNGESSFCTNDIVNVRYYSKGRKLVIENMTLKKHVHEDQEFRGTITDLSDKSVTVSSKSLTVTFSYNESTAISGKLLKGDVVKIIYLGNISEFPRAEKIVVTEQAKEEPNTLTVNGIISELTDGSLLLGIDSAHSRRFTINKSTKITGAAKELKEGDSVNVTFNNTKDAAPLAVEVNIVKEAVPQVRTINGKIKSIGDNAISLVTDEKNYTFVTDKNTKYKGVSPAVGCSAEVTYTVTKGKNLASVIYCQNKPDPKPAPEKPVTAKGTVMSWGNGKTTISLDSKGNVNLTYSNKLEKASDYTPKAKDYVQIKYLKSNNELTKIQLIERPDPPKPAPEQPVTAKGTLTSWTNGKCTVNVDGKDLALTYAKDLDISPGYNPQAKDEVQIAYTKSDNVLRKIELINRPAPPVPVVPVTAEGTLIAWGIGGENKCTVETVEATLNLTYDPKSLDIPAGYNPQADDNVRIQYMKDSSVLKKIELISRPDYSVTTEGTLTEWGKDGKNVCVVEITGSNSLTLEYDPNGLDIAIGYMPQANDFVNITYTSNNNMLTRIDLVKRPEPAPEPEKKEEPAPEPEKKEEPAPEPEKKEEPAPEPEEKEEVTPEPEQKEEAAPEPEKKEEPAPEPEPEQKEESVPEPEKKADTVTIKAEKVTIVSGDMEKKTVKIKLANGDTAEFKYNDDTTVSAGYIPQEGDVVNIVYTKDDMTLKEIELKDRPVKGDKEKPENTEKAEEAANED